MLNKCVVFFMAHYNHSLTLTSPNFLSPTSLSNVQIYNIIN